MLYILFIIQIISVISTTIYKNNIFLKKIDITNKLQKLLDYNLKDPIILDGNKTPFKKDLCHVISENNNMEFKEFIFDDFISQLPHLEYDNNILYIPDYLIGNGRILNHYESNALLQIPKTTNLIILETENLDKIAYKDNNVNMRFDVIKFPHIEKKDIMKYIFDTILEYNYKDDLLLLNWIKYDIELLNIEKINMLLFELNDMIIHNNVQINDIHKYINFVIDGLLEK